MTKYQIIKNPMRRMDVCWNHLGRRLYDIVIRKPGTIRGSSTVEYWIDGCWIGHESWPSVRKHRRAGQTRAAIEWLHATPCASLYASDTDASRALAEREGLYISALTIDGRATGVVELTSPQSSVMSMRLGLGYWLESPPVAPPASERDPDDPLWEMNDAATTKLLGMVRGAAMPWLLDEPAPDHALPERRSRGVVEWLPGGLPAQIGATT